jgi:hypothetical protein
MYVYGRFDALFRNKRTGKYILIDWKSSGTIDKVPDKWTKKMLGPMFKYPQLNWYSYTLQLYFYKQALLNSGYLPEGTNADDIIVMIVNLPDHIIPEVNMNYQIHQGAMPYDEVMMKNFYNFAIEKYIILESQKKDEEPIKEQTEQVNTEETNLTDIRNTAYMLIKENLSILDEWFYKINVDDQQNLASRFRVSGIPFFALFKDGKVVASRTGGTSKEVFEEWLSEKMK